MLPSASALASRREERVQKAFSVDHHGPGDARLSHRATAIYGEHSDYVRRAHGVRLFKPPVLTLFDSAYSDTVRVAFRRYQAGSTGSKGVKGAGTEQATWVLREAQALSQRPMGTHPQTAVPPIGYEDRHIGYEIQNARL